MPRQLFFSARRRALVTIGAATITAMLLAGCSSASPPAAEPPLTFGHIHALIPNEDGTVLVGTHNGLYTLSANGEVEGPLGDYDFDAMGLTALGEVLVASGHPGPETPAELGAPNLGIIRSEDDGASWAPIAFTGEEDFHILAAAPDDRLYGVGSSSTAVRISDDAGATWTVAADVSAAALAVTDDGTVYAATQNGTVVSRDGATSFEALADAPLLYLLDADGAELVGVDPGGRLWLRSGDGDWSEAGTAEGDVSAIGMSGSGAIYLADDRGIVVIEDGQARTILPAL